MTTATTWTGHRGRDADGCWTCFIDVPPGETPPPEDARVQVALDGEPPRTAVVTARRWQSRFGTTSVVVFPIAPARPRRRRRQESPR